MGENEKLSEKERLSNEITRQGPEIPVAPVLPTVNPEVEKAQQQQQAVATFHPAVYVSIWIALSSSVIIFNKWILSTAKFHYPVTLTCWHLTFATIMTQIMSRTTKLLDGRKTVKMTGRVYLRAIVPIGAMFSLSLICGNLTYLYLSVAFIQMLKATTPVAVLVVGYFMGTSQPDFKVFLNVSVIVAGVIIASIGEITFVLIGVIYQIGGILFEATRLVMVEQLLSSAEYKMDPLVSLYYFAPICAVMNFCVAVVTEIPSISLAEIQFVGPWVLLANAMIAFGLNVSVVFLIGRTSGLVMTLCGVLKDILLVIASVLIWGTAVPPLQVFGYSIAICGLVYYKLGSATLKAQLHDAGRAWAEYGTKHPALRKLIVFGASVVLILLLLGGGFLAPQAGYYDSKKVFSSVLKDDSKAN